MIRFKMAAHIAMISALLLGGIGCDPRITYEPGFVPVTFSIDLNGHIQVSAGQQFTTPIGTFGINVGLSKANLKKAKDGTLVVIEHERDGRWVKDVYAVREKQLSACLDGRFVMTANTNNEIVITAEPGSVVRIVSATNADQACSSSSISAPQTAQPRTGLVIRLDEPRPAERVPLQGSPVRGSVTGDLGDRTLWLFKYAPGAGKHFLNGQLWVHNGMLDGETGQVGSRSSADVGQQFTIEVVVADTSASADIQARQPNAQGDVAFDVLPHGAEIVRAVTVVRR
jgi:hypothetical protein